MCTIFEAFSDQRREIHLRCGRPRHASRARGYAPELLKDRLENQLERGFVENPSAVRFKLHDVQGSAMTRARMAGIKVEEAAIAFGCDPETMRQHYLALDEVAIVDRVLARTYAGGGMGQDEPTTGAGPGTKES